MYRRNFKKVNYADSAFTHLTKIMLIKVSAGFKLKVNAQVNLPFNLDVSSIIIMAGFCLLIEKKWGESKDSNMCNTLNKSCQVCFNHREYF